MEMPSENCSIKSLWSVKVAHKFNCICVGEPFRNSDTELLIGHEDGVLRAYELPSSATTDSTDVKLLKCKSSLETKGGPIQTLAIHDVSRLYANDVTVADSRGMVTVFSNEQILTRKAVSEHCIQCLQVQQDAIGNISIVTGDTEGCVSAFNPYNDQWRVRLSDVKPLKGVVGSPKVKSLLAVSLSNSHGHLTSYILATDDNKNLYFIQQGGVVLVLKTPANITAMCSGTFINPEEIETGEVPTQNGTASTSAYETQVALGSSTGAIYIMTNFQVYNDEFMNVQHPITHLEMLKAADTQSTDSILCTGDFNALYVLRDGKEVASHRTPVWINTMVTADIDKDGVQEVVIGCQDSSIHGLKLMFT